VIRHGAELLHAFAAASCPRITVILRKAFGGVFITMNSRALGADAACAWPAAEIGIMGPRAAIEILHRRQLLEAASPEREAAWLAWRYADEYLSPETAFRRGVIDAVIAPAETRGSAAGVLHDSRWSRDTGSGRLVCDVGRARQPRTTEGRAVWFTGPPSSGKSTIAAFVGRELRARGGTVEVLDGDAVRESLSKGLGFSKEDRDRAESPEESAVCVLKLVEPRIASDLAA
jgi:hypothetical protein